MRKDRISRRFILGLAASTGCAALAGLVLAVNFVLANRMGFSPVVPDSFDEGISLDALLVGVQIALLGVALAQLSRLRGEVREVSRPATADGEGEARR